MSKRSARADERERHSLRVSSPRSSPRDNSPQPPECPVTAVAQRALNSAQALARMLRMLRVSMYNCSECASRIQCPILVDFNAQFTIALQEIADEWQLSQ